MKEDTAVILQPGDKILVTHRRLFTDDAPRLFLGVVDHYEDGLILVTGHSWIRSPVLLTGLKAVAMWCDHPPTWRI